MKQNVLNWAAAALLCAGAIAANAASAATYTAILTGDKEAPPNASAAIGAASVDFDASTHMLEVSFAFAGLEANSTAAHIHCCTATPGSGTAGPINGFSMLDGFSLGAQTGAYSHFFDTSLSSNWDAAFLSANGGSTANAEAALLAGLNAGSAYLNVHSSVYPDGEIRGFLSPVTAVPEPAGLAMLGLGLPAVLMTARRRRKST